ncbi:hypothetical protein ACJX0J_009865, partial [Zea mays]
MPCEIWFYTNIQDQRGIGNQISLENQCLESTLRYFILFALSYGLFYSIQAPNDIGDYLFCCYEINEVTISIARILKNYWKVKKWIHEIVVLLKTVRMKEFFNRSILGLLTASTNIIILFSVISIIFIIYYKINILESAAYKSPLICVYIIKIKL